MAQLSGVLKLESISQFAHYQIPQSDAVTFINYYREGMAAGSVKSIWINQDILAFIVSESQQMPISGIRVYFGKYKEGVGLVQSTDAAKPYYKDTTTVILAVTETTSGGNSDITDGYFDYGKPCPPYCNDGDVGN
jgi:hypothetical protein